MTSKEFLQTDLYFSFRVHWENKVLCENFLPLPFMQTLICFVFDCSFGMLTMDVLTPELKKLKTVKLKKEKKRKIEVPYFKLVLQYY